MAIKAVSSVVVVQEANIWLKRIGISKRQLIGGKVEHGELPLTAALREAQEEIGIDLDPTRLEPLGCDEVREVTHHYFLYRLEESITPVERKVEIVPLACVKKRFFYWWPYWKAVRAAKSKLGQH